MLIVPSAQQQELTMLENLRTVSLLKQYGMVLIIWEINNEICKIKSHTIRKKKRQHSNCTQFLPKSSR